MPAQNDPPLNSIYNKTDDKCCVLISIEPCHTVKLINTTTSWIYCNAIDHTSVKLLHDVKLLLLGESTHKVNYVHPTTR